MVEKGRENDWRKYAVGKCIEGRFGGILLPGGRGWGKPRGGGQFIAQQYKVSGVQGKEGMYTLPGPLRCGERGGGVIQHLTYITFNVRAPRK